MQMVKELIAVLTRRSNLRLVGFYTIGLVVFLSCQMHDVKSILKSIRNSTIVFPAGLSEIIDGIPVETTVEMGDLPIMVVYYDSTECNTCLIEHLYEYERLQNDLGLKCQLILILSPAKDKESLVIHMLSMLNYDFKILLDNNNLFLKSNPVIPKDSRYHAFLIDKGGKPKVIGDPVVYPSLMKLIKKQL